MDQFYAPQPPWNRPPRATQRQEDLWFCHTCGVGHSNDKLAPCRNRRCKEPRLGTACSHEGAATQQVPGLPKELYSMYLKHAPATEQAPSQQGGAATEGAQPDDPMRTEEPKPAAADASATTAQEGAASLEKLKKAHADLLELGLKDQAEAVKARTDKLETHTNAKKDPKRTLDMAAKFAQTASSELAAHAKKLEKLRETVAKEEKAREALKEREQVANAVHRDALKSYNANVPGVDLAQEDQAEPPAQIDNARVMALIQEATQKVVREAITAGAEGKPVQEAVAQIGWKEILGGVLQSFQDELGELAGDVRQPVRKSARTGE